MKVGLSGRRPLGERKAAVVELRIEGLVEWLRFEDLGPHAGEGFTRWWWFDEISGG